MSKYNKILASLVFVPLCCIVLLLPMLLLPCVTGGLQNHAYRLDDQLHRLTTTLCDPTLQDQSGKQADGLL